MSGADGRVKPRGKRKGHERSWPDGWELGDAEWETAKRHGCPSRGAAAEVFDGFHEAALAKGYTYRSWPNAWAQWCIARKEGRYGHGWPALRTYLGENTNADHPPEYWEALRRHHETCDAVKAKDTKLRNAWRTMRWDEGVRFGGVDEAQRDFDSYVEALEAVRDAGC